MSAALVRAVKRMSSFKDKDGLNLISADLEVEMMSDLRTEDERAAREVEISGSVSTPVVAVNLGLLSCSRPPAAASGRPQPRRSLSENSVYRANSRYSLKRGVSQENKALDRLLHCLWRCSPGCQETP